MMKWLMFLINALLPPRCLFCGKVVHTDNSLCSDCFQEVDFITAPYCQHCGKPLSDENAANLYCIDCLRKKDIFRFCRSATKYTTISKKLILDFKFADHVENKKLLSHWLYFAGKDIFEAGVDLIIPVPLHYFRLMKRKYNQSAVLAAELSKLSSVPADYKSLKKKKRTLPQVQCDGKMRKSNVKNAFEVLRRDNIKGKRIVLIDDVFTTGSTLKECAKALKKAGAKSVDALTVARVYKNLRI